MKTAQKKEGSFLCKSLRNGIFIRLLLLTLYTAAHQAYKELSQAQRDIEAYLRQYEPQTQEQSRGQQKRKKDVLE